MALADCAVHPTLPVQDLARARSFYEDVLGLKAASETPGGIFFDAGAGTRVAVVLSQGASSGSHTQAGWAVSDIAAEVAELRSKGVVFEEYDFPSLKTVDGIADVPAGRAAWFKDPEGNLHGMVQLNV
jgi:catechol 2,3-dioxygenase-like lactoylglutathione lyase family enzyme